MRPLVAELLGRGRDLLAAEIGCCRSRLRATMREFWTALRGASRPRLRGASEPARN